VSTTPASNEQLAIRFIEILSDSAKRNGNGLPMSQMCAQATWRQVFVETVRSFLDELRYQVIESEGPINERHEDDQIRRLYENLTARQRLKAYSQLYALDCRIDGIERAIERLTTRPFDVRPRAS
jgi:hypothetical protein